MPLTWNRVYQGDCVKLLNKLEPGSVDLVFADPPFNIGYDYDVYDDRRDADDYLGWCREWIGGVHRALKPDGTFWLAIGDEFAAELKILAQREIGFHTRSWVIWYYTFGVNCKRGFSRSHTHLFHFVKDPEHFTFNSDNPAVRVPSARELVYADVRANPAGRLPDNTWILRPQDAPAHAFSPEQDTWYFARVAGTFKEREGFHGCQMPEQLLGRIIRTCSEPNQVVLDPFTGSGTTVSVAKKLGRQWIGFELSEEYVDRINQRLSTAGDGDLLDGGESETSAKPTSVGKRRPQRIHLDSPIDDTLAPKSKASQSKGRGASKAKGKGERAKSGKQSREKRIVDEGSPQEFQVELAKLVDTALGEWTPELPLISPDKAKEFLSRCEKLGAEVKPHTLLEVLWNQAHQLVAGQGKSLATKLGPRISNWSLDQALPAAEVGMTLTLRETERQLSELFCRPEVTQYFDRWLVSLAPDLGLTELRWAAWCRCLELRARQLAPRALEPMNWPEQLTLEDDVDSKLTPGVFVLTDSHQRPLLVGTTLELEGHLERWRGNRTWSDLGLSGYYWFPTGEPRPLAQRLRGTVSAAWQIGAPSTAHFAD